MVRRQRRKLTIEAIVFVPVRIEEPIVIVLAIPVVNGCELGRVGLVGNEVGLHEAIAAFKARAEIAKLQRILGKKTLENEILKEAVEYATEKKWIARSPLLPGDGE